MNAFELKAATTIARDLSIELAGYDDSCLFGFGLPDFEKVCVSLHVVAKCMRHQCLFIFHKKSDDWWDWNQYNEDLPFYRKNVLISDLTSEDARRFLVTLCTSVLERSLENGVTAKH